ncbi:MAG: hypothetical protein V1776_01455 [Candidatus Diapherotrites archaeon]
MHKMKKENTQLTRDDATSILRSAGMQVNDYARYVDSRGMIRFVTRKAGEFGVKNAGWREVSRAEAERIQRANAELRRNYLKPKMRKYF